jgi:hypothetical protein
VDGGPSAALSAADAAQLVDAAMRADAAAADAWAAISAVCATGDVATTGSRLLSASVLSGAAVSTLTRVSGADDAITQEASRCLEAVASVCSAVSSIGGTSPEESMTQRCGDVAAAVVGVMQRLQRRGDGDGDSIVARLGCIALWRLARLDSTQQDAIGAAGGVHAVLAAMQRHVDCVDVQESGCWALSHLVHRSVAHASAMVCGGGLGIVLCAMRRHPQAVTVQECGMTALRGLLHVVGHGCGDAMCSTAVAPAAAVEDVLVTMRQHVHSAALQQVGCAALLTLAGSSNDNKALIVARGGVEAVVAAMRRHVSCVEAQLLGCDALKTALTQQPRSWHRAPSTSWWLRCGDTTTRWWCRPAAAACC